MKKRYQITTKAFDKKGRHLSTGYNKYYKSNTWQKELSILAGLSEDRIYIHSEVDCLIKVRNSRKTAYSIQIERYDSYGNPKNAFPCKSCQLAIKLSGVKIVYFTTEDGLKEWIV